MDKTSEATAFMEGIALQCQNLGLSIAVLSSPQDVTLGVPYRTELVVNQDALRVSVVATDRVPDDVLWLSSDSGPLLLLCTHVSDRQGERLRAHGVNYVDLSGNAFVSFNHIRIDIRGRRRKVAALQPMRAATSHHLFSPKRSQVIFALLQWPVLVNSGMREVAFCSGVSIGQVQQTMALLSEAEFLVTGPRRRIRRVLELEDQWLAAFGIGLGSPVRARGFIGTTNPRVLDVGKSAVYVSGEAATTHIRDPQTLTVYVDKVDAQLVQRNGWKPADQPTVLVREKFWIEPGADPSPHPEVFRAPDLLVIADLMASGETRLMQVANELKQARHVR